MLNTCKFADLVHDKYIQDNYGLENTNRIKRSELIEARASAFFYQSLLIPFNAVGVDFIDPFKILNSGLTIVNTYNSYSITNLSSSYVHTQFIAGTIWTINHNLGYVPSVGLIKSTGGLNIFGVMTPVDNNTIIITFSVPYSGTAYLS